MISPAYSKQTAKIRRVPHVYFIAPDAILKEAAAWWSVDEWSEQEGGEMLAFNKLTGSIGNSGDVYVHT